MSIDELKKPKNNEGELLFLSRFLSTSVSQDMSLIYVDESDDETIVMIFQLTVHINPKTNSSCA
jgi:hypothetical protein